MNNFECTEQNDDSGSFNSLLRTSMAVARWLLSCKHGDTSLRIGGDR